MNAEIAIEIRNLVKEYRLYGDPKQRLKEMLFPFAKKRSTQFFAINGLTAKIPKSQCLGIIGKNGSGKSTLLKIIAGIVTPSSGFVNVKGRVAALLELGAGFNPELSGLENIATVCQLMGLSSEEISEITPKVIEFAEIGDHVSQPVKTYSSGMFVRLAFAVSVTVNPDILIIDEALAVGDARFQRKCFRKMQEFKNTGKTIILVSHALEQVREFCDYAILMDSGKIVDQGKPSDVVMKYFDLMFPKEAQTQADGYDEISIPVSLPNADGENWVSLGNKSAFEAGAFGAGGATLNSIYLSGLTPDRVLKGGQPVKLRASYKWDPQVIKKLIDKDFYAADMSVGIALADVRGNYIFGCNTIDSGLRIDPFASTGAEVEFRFHLPHVKTDNYFLTVTLALGTQEHHIQMNWYDGLAMIRCEASKKNTYGVIAIDYVTERFDSPARTIQNEGTL